MLNVSCNLMFGNVDIDMSFFMSWLFTVTQDVGHSQNRHFNVTKRKQTGEKRAIWKENMMVTGPYKWHLIM